MISSDTTEALVAALRGTGGRTIPEVLAVLASLGVDVEGENAMLFGEYVVAWLGMSADATAALNALVADERVEVLPSSEAAYLAVGYEAPFPAITAAELSQRFDEPRWLPTELIVRR
ncbi:MULTISPECIES: hypothetical protein [Microterricola]|uniref:Uncharacterized protein n=2 Tax=Microterricola TaxID=518733 RepID=A0A1H1V2K9_9MICO|nr:MULTISPECIES: hypothetical protein [Microterricola]PPL18744.1 hypothetical protein GY24_09530 [Microterricola pindariensis]SDS79008.1 hypothetical protein SAMN04489834_2156 [Microterricola viridarii]